MSTKNKIIIYIDEQHREVNKKVNFYKLIYELYGNNVKFFDEASFDTYFNYKGNRIMVNKLEPAIITYPETLIFDIENPQFRDYKNLIIVQNFPSILSDITWLLHYIATGEIIRAEDHFNTLYHSLNDRDYPDVLEIKNSLFNLFEVVYNFYTNPKSIIKNDNKIFLNNNEIKELDNFVKAGLNIDKIPIYFTNYFILKQFLPFIKEYGIRYSPDNRNIYDEWKRRYKIDSGITYLENLRDDIMVKTIRDYTAIDDKSILCISTGARHVENIESKLRSFGYNNIEITKSSESLKFIKKLKEELATATATAIPKTELVSEDQIFREGDKIIVEGLEKEKFKYLNGKEGIIIMLNAKTEPLRHEILINDKATTIAIQPKNLRKILI